MIEIDNEDEFDMFDIDILRASTEKEELISDDTLICECMCVSAGDIRIEFKNSQIVDLEVLKNKLCVGQGCSSCIKSFEQWKNKIF